MKAGDMMNESRRNRTLCQHSGKLVNTGQLPAARLGIRLTLLEQRAAVCSGSRSEKSEKSRCDGGDADVSPFIALDLSSSPRPATRFPLHGGPFQPPAGTLRDT